jgi:hypothetical protein
MPLPPPKMPLSAFHRWSDVKSCVAANTKTVQNVQKEEGRTLV